LELPNTPDDRSRIICEHSQGYVYLVSVTGTTGARANTSADLPEFVARVREITAAPVAVGFGISTPEQARAVAEISDGVIVGSAVVQHCESEGAETKVRTFVGELRGAMAR